MTPEEQRIEHLKNALSKSFDEIDKAYANTEEVINEQLKYNLRMIKKNAIIIGCMTSMMVAQAGFIILLLLDKCGIVPL